MLVTKADGSQERFKPSKLKNSLRKAGASKSEIERIVRHIERTLTDGVKTQTIYRKAFELLRESEEPIAAKYSLRRAIFGLGPTGFPFEDFLARLFEAEGYATRRRVIIKGKCATHEIDIAAFKPNHSFVVEAKFHMRPGIKSDIQVALYSYARHLDLKSHSICKADTCGIVDQYLITNTKFTSAAIRYAECTGIKLLDWAYPYNGSLQDKVEAAGMYPVTVLTHLSTKQKRLLLERGLILCRDVVQKPDMLLSLGISHAKTKQTIDEAAALCGSS